MGRRRQGWLLRHALDDESTPFRYLLALRQEILERRRIAIRFMFFEALPLLNNNARFRRVTIHRSDRPSGGKEFISGRLDRGLSLRDIGRMRGLICDIDFSDRVDRRPSLGMKSLHREPTKAKAGEC
jgi:hypothetical protein